MAAVTTQMTVAELLAKHPFPVAYANANRVEHLWVYDLPGTPEALWPFISDTSRMNRALETAEMKFEERDGKRWGTASLGGIAHEWVEVPWNWVANQWLTSVRIYTKGLFKAVYAVNRLEKTERGTRLYLYYAAIPRGPLSRLLIKIGYPRLKKAYDRVLPALAAQLDRLRPDVLVKGPAALAEGGESRLKAARQTLIETDELPAASVDALLDWIRTGDDIDLHRIQVRERARVWKLPEQDVLRVALYATRAGLLTLSWDTVCPHCRGVRDENETLSKLAAQSHCTTCDVDFTTDTQESVEVTFRVHPSIRDVPMQLYCSAEPARKHHIRVNWTLAPGTAIDVTPHLRPGRYTVRCGMEGGWYLDIGDTGVNTVTWKPLPAGEVVQAVEAATIEVANEASAERTFIIEEAGWSDHALRAGHLLSFQEFRDLFSEDYIGADVRLGVGQQTLLFTDVVGSTAFYASRGDPAAFVEIKKHFDEVFKIVADNRGAVVKTIGDAVMATFVEPVDAVRASRQIHDAFHPGRTDTPIRLRISLNTGPCIAVRLNSNADFFGGTVNVAAKLQAMAEGYQIAMSLATYTSPGVAEYIRAEASADAVETREYTSKALAGPVGVKLWTVHKE